MSAANWVEGKYSFWFLYLPGRITVTVGWDKGGFKVTFLSLTLKERFSDVQKAKSAGVALAKRTLTQALAMLPETEQIGTKVP